MLKGAQNIYSRATNLGKEFNLRVRSPFCDLLLVEWSFALSGELFLQVNKVYSQTSRLILATVGNCLARKLSSLDSTYIWHHS
ncbi:MAG: hypothetical protein AAFV71_08525 [Cyanobacteria bacterium J06633_8]